MSTCICMWFGAPACLCTVLTLCENNLCGKLLYMYRIYACINASVWVCTCVSASFKWTLLQLYYWIHACINSINC